MASTQLIASQAITTCPIQEWLLQIGIVGQHFLRHKIQPTNGLIALPTAPGMSLDFDEGKIESRDEIQFS